MENEVTSAQQDTWVEICEHVTTELLKRCKNLPEMDMSTFQIFVNSCQTAFANQIAAHQYDYKLANYFESK